MRILFSAWPGYGHLLPMVPLVGAAQRAGHDVVVATGPDLVPYASSLGVATVTAGPTAAESYSRLPSDVPISRLPASEQTAFAGEHLFGAAGVVRARDLAVFCSTWKPDLVVHDPLELGAAAVAADTGTAQVTHGYGPMLAVNEDMIRVIGSTLARALGVDPAERVFAAPYLDICPPGMRTRRPLAWNDVRSLRPWAGPPGDGSVAGAIAALPYPDTVYLTLGTVMNQALDVFRAVLDAAEDVAVNVVTTTGPGLDPEAIGPLPRSALVYPFLPQADVLPSCSAVVSHAGAGTMLGALCFGLPQLCLPQSTDQPLNAASLVATGAGLSLSPDETHSATVAAALRTLLHDPSYREAAARLRTAIEALPHPDAVVDELTAWARSSA
jgi:UDP:flavonoid glycosyltransferase YjiC (YdhE family)